MKGLTRGHNPDSARRFAAIVDCPKCGVPADVFCINLAVVKAGVAKKMSDTVWPHPERYRLALAAFNKGAFNG